MASDNSVNNTLRKDLGPVSAYAVAVAHGFDGTEAEWEQYIANASTKAAQASASATAAAQSEENAETAKEAAETAKVEAQTAAQSASAAYGTSLLAPNYSTEATYTVGQHVIYSGNIYSCTTAITTPEAWDATHWTQVQVGNEVSDLKSAIISNNQNFANQLHSSDDLNSISVPGVYFALGDATPNILNKPTDFPANGFRLIVTTTITSNRFFQFLLSFGTKPRTYLRSNYNGVWNPWVQFTDETYKESINYNYGILGNNTDLNTVQKNSIYELGSDKTYTNKPADINSGYLFTFVFSSGIVSQEIVSLNMNEKYGRRLLNNSWSDWKRNNTNDEEYAVLRNSIISNNQNLITQLYANNDLDTLSTPGTFFALGDATPNILNVPAGLTDGFRLVVTNSIALNRVFQILFSFKAVPIVYIRTNYSGAWNQWAKIAYDIEKSSLNYNYGTLESNTDLNTVITNSIYGLNSEGNYTNKPIGFNSGYLFTVVYGSGFVTQIAMTLNGSAVYTRRKNASDVWSDWILGIHNATEKYFAFGDSTTYGQIGGTGGQSRYNYPACVGKVLGMDTNNKAVGGQGLIKDWDAIHTNYITNLDMTGAKLITVGWAYNDSEYYSAIPFGAYDDTGDSTFIGKYYTIMKEFQQKCPSAKIILITGYGKPDGQVGPPVVKPTLRTQFTGTYTFSNGTKTVKQVYDTLEEMCNLHGWSCVNQSRGTVFNEWNASILIGDQIHPTNDGYLIYGNYLAARISSMYANISSLAF